MNNNRIRFADDVLVAFSLWKNTKALISLKRDPSDIGPIHGIRLINAILLVLSHKTMAVFFNPHVNRTAMIEVSANSITRCIWSLDRWFDFCFDFIAGFGSIYFRDWTCRSTIYGRISSDERIADILCNHWQSATQTITTSVPGICWPIHADCADFWCIDSLLHVHFANYRVRSAVEFSCQPTCRKLQTVLVAEFAFHS